MTTAIEVATKQEYNLEAANDLAQVWLEEAGPDFQPEFPRIKVPSGGGTTWEDPDDPNFEPRRELRGIIVAFHDSSRLYLESFESASDDAARRPDAWSVDGKSQVVPPETYEKIQRLNAANGWELPFPSTNLAECPYNKFIGDPGAAILPGQTSGKANNEYRELFMVLPGAAPIPYQISIPASSIKGWDGRGGYKNRLLTRGIRLHTLETVLQLQQEKGPGNVTYSKVVFVPGRNLETDLLAITGEFAQGIRAVITNDPFAASRGAIVPAIEAAPAAPAQLPAPVQQAAPAPVAPAAPAPVAQAAPPAPAPAAPAPVAPDAGVQNIADTFGATPVAPVAAAAPAAPVAAPAPVAQAAPAPVQQAAPAAPAAPAPAPVAAAAAPVEQPVAPVAVAVGSGAAVEDDIDF